MLGYGMLSWQLCFSNITNTNSQFLRTLKLDRRRVGPSSSTFISSIGRGHRQVSQEYQEYLGRAARSLGKGEDSYVIPTS